MPAAGRSCRQPRPSLRPSVRSTPSPPPPQPGRPGPAQRRPEQPRPREETGAAPARPCPRPPPRLSVRSSTRLLALPSFCPAASLWAGLPAPSALSLPGSLSLCLCPRGASQPLPRSPVSGPPLSGPLIPRSLPFWAPPFLGTRPHGALPFWGAFSSEHRPHSPTTPFSASLTSFGGPPFHLSSNPCGLAPLLALISSGFFLSVPLIYAGTSEILGVSLLGPPKAPQLPDFTPPCYPWGCLCGCGSLFFLRPPWPPSSGGRGLPLCSHCFCPCICLSGLTTQWLLC